MMKSWQIDALAYIQRMTSKNEIICMEFVCDHWQNGLSYRKNLEIFNEWYYCNEYIYQI